MSKNPSNEIFKGTLIVYYALLLGQLLVSGMLVFMNSGNEFPPERNNLFLIVGISVLVGCIMASFTFYNNAKRKGAKVDGLSNKIDHFRQSNIVRWALMEGANLILIVFFFLYKDNTFLALFGLGILAFLMAWPSVNSFAKDYDLTNSEVNALKNQS